MEENAKNQLLELLDNLGCNKDCAVFESEPKSLAGFHHSTVAISFPDGCTVRGTGKGWRKTEAEISAAKAAIEQLHDRHLGLIVDWTAIKAEAQAGDALIKLSVYLSTDIKSVSDKSQQLQCLESDSHLAKVFDQWKAQGDPDLAIWGDSLGEKRKATLVEAILWQRFGKQVIATNAPEQLQLLIKILAIK